MRVCRRLGGLPLAIELAAVRLRSMSIEDLEHRLDDLFRVLTRNDRTALEHHRTMRAMVAWSYDLCTPEEHLFWAWASIFDGQFDLAGPRPWSPTMSSTHLPD